MTVITVNRMLVNRALLSLAKTYLAAGDFVGLHETVDECIAPDLQVAVRLDLSIRLDVALVPRVHGKHRRHAVLYV